MLDVFNIPKNAKLNKRCHYCARDTVISTLVRVVAIDRTDNHYHEVCATCAIELCDVQKTFRRIMQQPIQENTL